LRRGIQRQAGSQTSTLASLMMLYQGQGKTDEAKQLAHVLLRRTVPPVSAMAASARNPLRYSTAENHVRTQALQVLQQTGELPALIQQLEEQRSRSPDAPRLYEQLIEYYNAANQREKVGELLEQAVARRPDAPVFRYRLAQHLERTGKGAEACDHYLELLRQKPEWLADNLYSIRQLFQRAERTLDLVEAIREIDVKTLEASILRSGHRWHLAARRGSYRPGAGSVGKIIRGVSLRIGGT
jgi:tetratricopeptide (TPR) repeat protein